MYWRCLRSCSRPRTPPRPTTAGPRGPWSPVHPRVSAPPPHTKPPRAASTCFSPPAARSSCGRPCLLALARPPTLPHALPLLPQPSHVWGWVRACAWSGPFALACRACLPAACRRRWQACVVDSVDSGYYHPHLYWQAVADEIRASSSGVLVEIVPCDLGRATGVARLCAAAERRDVTLAVLTNLAPAACLLCYVLPTAYRVPRTAYGLRLTAEHLALTTHHSPLTAH